MSMMNRVFFDTNTGDPDAGYPLTLPRSLEDIEKLDPAIREGSIVTLYMPDELEVTAELRFDKETRCWRGIPTRPWDFRDK